MAFAKDNSYEVAFVGICGSDLHKIRNGEITDPFKLGHELVINNASGYALANPMITCNNCDQCNNGRDMFCQSLLALGRNVPGGLSGTVCLPKENIVPVALSDPTTGVLGDPLAVVLHGLSLVEEKSKNSESALILGDGIIAQLTAFCLKTMHSTIKECQIITSHPARVGALQTLVDSVPSVDTSVFTSASYDSLSHSDVDLVIETVGRAQAVTIQTAIKSIAPRGTILGFGVYPQGYEAPTPLRELMYKEATIIGSNSYEKKDLLSAARLLEKYETFFHSLIHMPIPISKLHHAFEVAMTSDDAILPRKVVVNI